MFQCNAKGTNVSVTWIFNESTCNPDNCELNATTAYQNASDIQINGTLKIKTDLLPVTVYTLQCIVEQNLEYSQVINNMSLVTTFNLTVTKLDELLNEFSVTELGKYNFFNMLLHNNYYFVSCNHVIITCS